MVEEFKQYYPTYKFKKRDVVLAEFNNALNIATSQHKLYLQLMGLLVGFLSVLVTMMSKVLLSGSIIGYLKYDVLIIMIIYAIFGLIVLRVFTEIQRTITLNARKVTVLRYLLGLDYGRIAITLPTWRLEGASNPYAIRFFSGWFQMVSLPFWMLCVACFILSYYTIKEHWPSTWYWFFFCITVIHGYVFRAWLHDTHENTYLRLVKIVARITGLQLVNNFEYVIYRMKLAYYEHVRLGYELDVIKKLLICIEDATFQHHRGVQVKAIVRGLLSQVAFFRNRYKFTKSGGSTITMQIVRTLFISDLYKVWRRKICEILLALWFERKFSKSDIVNYYIASVSFGKGIFGLASATQYYFTSAKKRIFSAEEALFLVERLSSRGDIYRAERIGYLADKVRNCAQIDINQTDLMQLYSDLERKGIARRKQS